MDYDFPPDLLPLLVEVVTGTAMDDFGNLRAVSSRDWTETKETFSHAHLRRSICTTHRNNFGALIGKKAGIGLRLLSRPPCSAQ